MYIGANRDIAIAVFNHGKTDKFIRILINDEIFFINVEEKIIFSLTSEEKFSGKLVKNLRRKTTGIILVGTVCYLLLFSNVKRVEAMGTSIVPQTPIVRITQSSSNQYSNVGSSKVLINYQKEDKISLRNVCEIEFKLY